MAIRGTAKIGRFLAAMMILIWGWGCMEAFAYDLGRMDVRDLEKSVDDWVILDARPSSKWQQSHIPGARSFSWEAYTRTDEKRVKFRILSAEKLAVSLGEMGIHEKTPVVFYGDADSSWGGEGWGCWVLVRMGHQGPVRLLDGGIQRWQKVGFPVSDDEAASPLEPTTYRFEIRTKLTATLEEVQHLGKDQVLIDTRSNREWFFGHLPDAVHLSWKQLVQGEDRRVISAEAYRQLLRDRGITNDRKLIFYCTGGIRSAFAWLVHQFYGSIPGKNFEGGTAAWRRRNY